MLNTGYHWRTLPVGVLFVKEKFTVSGKEIEYQQRVSELSGSWAGQDVAPPS